jgi:hypothetical protein
MAGLGLQSAFAGQSLDDMLQKLEANAQATKLANAKLAIEQQNSESDRQRAMADMLHQNRMDTLNESIKQDNEQRLKDAATTKGVMAQSQTTPLNAEQLASQARTGDFSLAATPTETAPFTIPMGPFGSQSVPVPTRFAATRAMTEGEQNKQSLETASKAYAANPKDVGAQADLIRFGGAPYATWLDAQNKAANPTPKAQTPEERYLQIDADLNQKKPVTPEDQAFHAAYEHNKVIGTDQSGANSKNLAGLNEISNKYEQPYLTAKQSSDEMRSMIEAATAGNKVGAAMQGLTTTMAVLASNGFKRINTTELGVTGSAGDLYDRVNGWIQKARVGDPVPDNIKKDMLTIADILAKNAYKHYSDGADQVVSNYGLSGYKKLAPPTDGAPQTKQFPNGHIGQLLPDGTYKIIK